MKALSVVSGGLMAASTVVVGLALMSPGSASTADDRTNLAPDAFRVACDMVIQADLYLIPPRDVTDAKERDFATTPEEAVARALAAPAFQERDLGVLTVAQTRAAVLSTDGSSVPNATQFAAADQSGKTAAVITVEDLGNGAFAMTGYEVCSK